MVSNPQGTLIGALRDEDRIIAARAAQLLGDLGANEAVGPLVDYVKTSRHHCKTAGFAALAAIGDRNVCGAIRPLVDAPNVEDDWYWIGCKGVRAAAAVTLLALGDDTGAACLRALADANEDVFFAWFAPAILALDDELAAVAALKARITVDAYTTSGIRNVRLTDPGVVVWVVKVFGMLADPAAQEQLREYLGWHSRYVRGQAALSLIDAADSEANVHAVSALLAEDPTEFVRIQASLALVLAGRSGSAAIAELVDAASDPFDQATAVDALGALGETEHASLVVAQLTHEDSYVRRCAISAAGRVDRAGSRALIERLESDPDPLVRLEVAKFMAEGGEA